MVDLHFVTRYDRPFPAIRSLAVGPYLSLIKLNVGSIYLGFSSHPLYFRSLAEFDEKDNAHNRRLHEISTTAR